MTLKTMPNTGTYFPPKCSVDGVPHYLVPVSMWHDHEDDAREAHVLQGRVDDLELRLAVEAVNQELVDALNARVAELEAENARLLQANRDVLAWSDALRSDYETAFRGLDRLARLGNEPHYGNSTGNQIAIDTIDSLID